MNKLIRACIALAAFAALAVVPATASAVNDPLLTAPTGTKIVASHASPVGITGTNVGNLVMTGSNTSVLTECTTATMTGDLETNTGTGAGTGTVEGTIKTASFTGHAAGGECTGSFGNVTVTANPGTNGLPWCLRSTTAMNTDEFQVRGNGCTSASRPIRFILHSTTIGECTYERSTAVAGTYTTHPSAAEMSISHQEFKRVAGSFFCPSAGFLDMKFKLSLTAGGGSVWVDNQ